MYEFYSKEKIEKLFPILKTNATAIINFVSCDGNMGYKLAGVIGALNPQIKYSFENNCKEGSIKKGSILINKKTTPFIIQLPFKDNFKDSFDPEYIREGFEKIAAIMKKNILNLDSIAIQKGIIPDEDLEIAIRGLILPDIIYFDEVSPYPEKKEKKEKKKNLSKDKE